METMANDIRRYITASHTNYQTYSIFTIEIIIVSASTTFLAAITTRSRHVNKTLIHMYRVFPSYSHKPLSSFASTS